MERSRRTTLFLLAAILIATLYYKGHDSPCKGDPVAFVHHAGSPEVTIRLTGVVPHPGVYRFPAGVSVHDVIKMTVGSEAGIVGNGAGNDFPLYSGDVVEFSGDALSNTNSTSYVKSMAAGERMLLGIPLQADQMNSADWQCLPGIGPGLAERIVRDRHNNGAFHTIYGVQRVPGIGPKKFDAIYKFF